MLDKDFFNGRIIILDGAMGTMLQRYGLAEEDFHTDIIDSQAVRELKGNNECLNLSHPEIIREIHLEYIKAGADYIITQMFFDNSVFYSYVEKCRKAGINVPIIPGLKPLSSAKQITLLPQSFSLDIPKELTDAVRDAGDDKEEVYRIGTEWCIKQCKDLIKNEVPAVHFYTMGKTRNITQIMRECF